MTVERVYLGAERGLSSKVLYRRIAQPLALFT
jgi:hypothetical protein